MEIFINNKIINKKVITSSKNLDNIGTNVWTKRIEKMIQHSG
jgi:hypothetical protein